MTKPPTGTAPLTPVLRREIERWFVRRGVPQLIEGYATEAAMDSRAAPWISAWLVLGTVRDWGTRPDWPLLANLIGIAATMVWIAAAWIAVSRLRGRPFGRRPAHFDIVDIATMVVPVAVPAAVVHGSLVAGGAAVLGALTGIGLIYLIVGFGLAEIGLWTVQRLGRQLPHLVELVARTVPLLLILVVFLLFASEIWEVAAALNGAEVGFVLLLLVAVAALLVVITVRRELRRIEVRTDRDGLLADASDSPAAPLLASGAVVLDHAPAVTWVQRFNLTLLVAIPQLVQAIAVGAVVMGFLVAFGIVALPKAVQQAWIGGTARAVVEFSMLDEVRLLSIELLIVSAVLGGFVGLYFSGLSISDPTYRSEGFDPAVAEVRQLLAARAVYAVAVRAADSAARVESQRL